METLCFLCATITIGCASRAPQAQVRGDCDAPNSAHAAKTNSRLRSRAWHSYSPLRPRAWATRDAPTGAHATKTNPWLRPHAWQPHSPLRDALKSAHATKTNM